MVFPLSWLPIMNCPFCSLFLYVHIESRQANVYKTLSIVYCVPRASLSVLYAAGNISQKPISIFDTDLVSKGLSSLRPSVQLKTTYVCCMDKDLD